MKLLGFSSTTLKLPEALAGIASVPLLVRDGAPDVEGRGGRRGGRGDGGAADRGDRRAQRTNRRGSWCWCLCVLALLAIVHRSRDRAQTRGCWPARCRAPGVAFNVRTAESRWWRFQAGRVGLPRPAGLAHVCCDWRRRGAVCCSSGGDGAARGRALFPATTPVRDRLDQRQHVERGVAVL